MATETETPQLTVLTRVANIPLVSDSLSTIHSTLTNNAYTKKPYSVAAGLGSTAYRVSEPIQVRLAPVITRADGYANKAVDVVESRYPYPFRTPTGEIYGDIRQHGEHAVGVANKTIDDRVRTPAYGIAQGIDQSFTPVVDRFEVVVKKINGKTSDSDVPSPGDVVPDMQKDKFQYQRAYRLSMGLKYHLFVYTTEQMKQIQEHNVLVQRATATAHNITSALATSYGAASARVQALSDTMLSELHTLQSSAAALPAHAQASLHNLSERIGTVIGEVSGVLRSDAPVSEKLAQLRITIEHQVQPLLASATDTAYEAMKSMQRKSEETADKATNGAQEVANGNGSAH